MDIKPKRGTAFIDKKTGEKVFLNRIVDDKIYFVCNHESQGSVNGIDIEFYRVKISDLTPVKKVRQPIKQSSDRSPSQLAKAIEIKDMKDNLNLWFADQIPQIPEFCENCGKKLMAFTSNQKRFVTAHILPKTPNGGFPSVATHPQNRMFLGVSLFSLCNCHDLWDQDRDTRSAMPCHKIAVQRFSLFKELLTTKELIKALDYLKIN